MIPTVLGTSRRRRCGGVRDLSMQLSDLLLSITNLSAFLTVPLYSLSLSLRNQAPTNRYETVSFLFRCLATVCLDVLVHTALTRYYLLRWLGLQPLHGHQVPQSKRHFRSCRRFGCWVYFQPVRPILPQWKRLCRHGESSKSYSLPIPH